MAWVWTDEIEAAIREQAGVDPSILRTWRSAPVAVHADADETMTSIARRLGVPVVTGDELDSKLEE
jgi:hypothetical protein